MIYYMMVGVNSAASPDDVIKWKHFPRNWPFVRGIYRSPVNSPRKGQWRGALMFSSICAWINGWVNNRKAGDLRRHSARYDLTVMILRHLVTNRLYEICGDRRLGKTCYVRFCYMIPIVKNTLRRNLHHHNECDCRTMTFDVHELYLLPSTMVYKLPFSWGTDQWLHQQRYIWCN